MAPRAAPQAGLHRAVAVAAVAVVVPAVVVDGAAQDRAAAARAVDAGVAGVMTVSRWKRNSSRT